jgi:aminoglycoside N3'-acetyltransferase
MWRLTDEMKEEVKVEAEELRKELKTVITESFVVCFPSWCTGYCDMEASKTEIDKAIDKVISEL